MTPMNIRIFGALFFILGVARHMSAYAGGFQYWMHVVDDKKVDAYNNNRTSFAALERVT